MSSSRLSRPPDWLGRDVLPGGFETDHYLAGGEVLDWEREAFRVHQVAGRAELNRFFLSATGRQQLKNHLARGSYDIDQPEEAALLAASCLPDNRALVDQLEPFFAEVRFYPRTLPRGSQDPPLGSLCRESPGQVLQSLASYSLPLDVLRKRESLSLWRPLTERMMERLWETVEEGWPFQNYPHDWKEKTSALVSEIENALRGEVFCCFPRRDTSDFCRLFQSLKTAFESPKALSGRDFSFCKSRLDDSLQRWGPLGGTTRPGRVSERELPGEDVLQALPALKRELAGHSTDVGLVKEAAFFEALPEPLRKKAQRCRLGTLDDLRAWGLVRSIDVLAELAPRLVSGVFGGPRAGLLSRCYRAFGSNKIRFEQLPWIAPLWETPPGERLERATRLLLEEWWNRFPQYAAPPRLESCLTTLAGWLDLKELDLHQLATVTGPEVDYDEAVKACRRYTEELRQASCPKPYQRRQRDKRLKACAKQAELFRLLG